MQTPDDLAKVLLGIAIGFLPSQAARYLERRAERRKAIARALADLLEVRHQLVAVEMALEKVLAALPIPQGAELGIRALVNQLLPNPKELHQRFDEAVTTVAGLDPLLAYELRSKDLIHPLMQQLTALMNADPQTATFFSPLIKKLIKDEVAPQMKKAILRLAFKYGLITRWKVRGALARQDEPPKAIDSFLAPIAEEVKRMSASAGQ